jgi:hypothetical protein
VNQQPYYVLFLRQRGSECYTNEAGDSNKTELIAQANRALMRGAATAMVVKVEFWEGQHAQGHRGSEPESPSKKTE